MDKKLYSLYLPVISNIATYRWKTRLLPEIDYFSGIENFVKKSSRHIKGKIKSALIITALGPLSIPDFIRTEEGKRLYELGKQRSLNIQKYWYADLREWSIANWGTKRNALSTFVDWDARQIIFDTAETAPVPIMHALHKAFPNLKFEWLYADENSGKNSGIAISENGKPLINELEDDSQELHKTYVECLGKKGYAYQDEDGDWHWYCCD